MTSRVSTWCWRWTRATSNACARSPPPTSRARIGLLLEYGSRFALQREVPDPYYGPPAGFERVLDLVEDACDGLLGAIQRDLGTK